MNGQLQQYYECAITVIQSIASRQNISCILSQLSSLPSVLGCDAIYVDKVTQVFDGEIESHNVYGSSTWPFPPEVNVFQDRNVKLWIADCKAQFVDVSKISSFLVQPYNNGSMIVLKVTRLFGGKS